MRAVALTAAALLALAGCAETRGQGRESAEARFIAGMERAGCTVDSDAKAAIVEKHTGFDEDTLRAISDALLARGALVTTNEGIRLTVGACANA